jgi:metal-sulfur cluster biosynthetic enzyme
MGDVLVGDVKARVGCVPNVQLISVDLVFDPPWSRDMMSEEAQLATGMFY